NQLLNGSVPEYPIWLDLDFAGQRYETMNARVSLADILTFTRASGGGRFNAQGQYEWLPADTPRIDYDPLTGECKGLLIEEQRTNLLGLSNAPELWGTSAGVELVETFTRAGYAFGRLSTEGGYQSFSCIGTGSTVGGTVAVAAGRYVKSFLYIPGDAPSFWDRTPTTSGGGLLVVFSVTDGVPEFSHSNGSTTGWSFVSASVTPF